MKNVENPSRKYEFAKPESSRVYEAEYIYRPIVMEDLRALQIYIYMHTLLAPNIKPSSLPVVQMRSGICIRLGGSLSQSCCPKLCRQVSSQPHQVTVGVVGTGNFGSEHCAAIQACDSTKLGVLIDPCSKTRQLATERFPGVPAFSNISQANDPC